MTSTNASLFKDRNAILIFSSQLVSSVCDKMMSIGLVWYLTKNFNINVVPWFLTVSFLPHVILSIYSTRIINFIGPLKTVIYSEFFRGIVLVMLTLAIVFYQLSDQALLISLFISAFFIGIGSSLFNPAILSLPPQLVDEKKVVGLNALIDSSLSISTILGAAFAIILLNFLDLKNVILINALSFFWAGFLQMLLRPIVNGKTFEDSKDQIVITPIQVLKKYPEISRLLMSFLILNLIFTPLLVLMPWYVDKIYLGNSATLAILEGAMGVGAFSSALYLSLTHFKIGDHQRIKMVSILSFVFGLLFLLFAFSTGIWQGALAIFLIGVFTTFFNIQVLTHFQMAISSQEIPAIMTAVNIISAASIPISLSVSGLIFPHVSIPNFAKICGIAIIFVSFLLPKYLRGLLWKSA